MAGFPPLDKFYYEQPSLRVGGWIGFLLTIQTSNKLDLFPGRGAHLSTTARPFDSLYELIDFLKGEHRDATYYRGQTRRYETTYQGHIARLAAAVPWAKDLEISFEALIPSLFRPIVKKSPPDWESYHYPPLLDQIAPAIRAIINSKHDPIRHLLRDFFKEELMLIAMRNVAARRGWELLLPPGFYLPQSNISKRLLSLTSLSQHYEYGSTMVDLTGSVDAAGWFSSHHWSGEVATDGKDGNGVIYRFNMEVISAMIDKELQQQTPAAAYIRASGLFGLADISTLGDELGLRPRQQAGASLFGLENSIIYLLLNVYQATGAIDVFTFPLSSVDGRETELEKFDLCPPEDSALQVFNEKYMKMDSSLGEEEIVTFLKDESFSDSEIGSIKLARARNII